MTHEQSREVGARPCEVLQLGTKTPKKDHGNMSPNGACKIIEKDKDPSPNSKEEDRIKAPFGKNDKIFHGSPENF